MTPEKLKTPEEMRKSALRFLHSDYDPRLDPRKTPWFERMKRKIILWWRSWRGCGRRLVGRMGWRR